jgi:anti-sigma regulatory factor (Ser/Thr protein kinase)
VQAVKSIFKPFFTAHRSGKPVETAEEQEDKSAYASGIHDYLKQELIGWIASRMRHKLMEAGTIPGRNTDLDPSRYIADLVEYMVGWEERGEDVYLKLKEYAPPDPYYRCFLEFHEEYKEDIRLHLPALRSRSPENYSEQDEVWQVYRDVIYAVTQRKFLLIRRHEVQSYKKGRSLCRATITERQDIPKAREAAKQCFIELGVPQTELMSHLLVISEAITNILKHARTGTMEIVLEDSEIHVLVEDEGPGFPLKLLPNAALMSGYSTKKSLGQGFTLMMKMTERVLLSTIPGEGSSLILIFKRKEIEQQ